MAASSVSTQQPSDTMVEKPAMAHQKAESTTSSDNDNSEQTTYTEHVSSTSEEKNGSSSQQSPAGPSEDEYPKAKQVAISMTAMFLAVFLVALDRTIISTAIPSITDEFHSLDDIGWYGSAFMLTSSCFQLLLGRVYMFHSPKFVFLIMILVFEVGSAICGAAPSSVAFIIGRAIAGIGSAGIMAGVIILLVAIVPLAKRPVYMGLFGGIFGLASVAGPLLGGVFTTDVTWRWCFYINLPIGGVSMIVIFFILKAPKPVQPGLTIRQQIARLDLLGELFLLPSIICLLLALQWGGSTYAWSNGRIIALFVVFGVCLIAFVVVQIYMQEVATIPAGVIKNRSIYAGMWFVFCINAVMLCLIYYIPVWFQAIKGTSAVTSGIDTLPFVLSMVISVISAGQLTGRIGYYTLFIWLSAVILPIGAGLISTFNLDTSTGQWIGYQIVLGAGIGVGLQQGNMAAQTVLDRKDVTTGVALMLFCQQFSGAIFVSVGQNVLDTNLVAGLRSVVPEISPIKIVNTGATDLRRIVPKEHLHGVLVAYNLAVRQVFIVGVSVACLASIGAFAMEWRSVKGKQGPTAKKGSMSKVNKPENPEDKV